MRPTHEFVPATAPLRGSKEEANLLTGSCLCNLLTQRNQSQPALSSFAVSLRWSSDSNRPKPKASGCYFYIGFSCLISKIDKASKLIGLSISSMLLGCDRTLYFYFSLNGA